MTQHKRTPATGGTLFLALLTITSYAGAQTPVTIFSFIGGSDGEVPMGNLATAGPSIGGNVLYGATYSFPSTAFSLTPPAAPGDAWTQSVLYVFGGGPGGTNDGYLPMGGVVAGIGGVLYGTTLNGGGGTKCGQALGCGTVFSLTPPATPTGAWDEAVLYGFSGGSDGALPTSGVVIGGGGVLYGATANGGASNAGTVFSLTPPASAGGAWTESVLHSFAGGADGASPQGRVLVGPGGLYGTTYSGGTSGCGTVFQLKPSAVPGGPWVNETLYSFACAPDGSSPDAGVVMNGAGVLYGTTHAGGSASCECGTVFSLTPPKTPGASWTETVLHSFAAGSDGSYPTYAGVTVGNGGVLYGTTNGSENDAGAVFSLTPPPTPGGKWTAAVFSFGTAANSGAGPYGGLVIGPDGFLYGTTTRGGARNNGAVFAWKP
jgi:uncharacterized repeat protein (TIGR03803 family)